HSTQSSLSPCFSYTTLFPSLVIISRTLPPRGIAQLRMKGQMTEITSKHLALDADEAQRYLEQRLPFEVSREHSERAVRRVEGWRSEEHTSELQSRENIVCRL